MGIEVGGVDWGRAGLVRCDEVKRAGGGNRTRGI